MAVQTNTRKAETIVASKNLIKKVQDNLGKINSNELIERINQLGSKITDILTGKYGNYPKIQNKPFYYSVEGSFYIVDPQRYLVPNTGDFSNMVVENVPVQYPRKQFYSNTNKCWTYYDVQYIVKMPFWVRNENPNDKDYIVNKDGKKYTHFSAYEYNESFRSSIAYSHYLVCSINSGKGFGITCSKSGCSSITDNFPTGRDDFLRLGIYLDKSVQNAIRYNLMPEDLTSDEKEIFNLAVDYYRKNYIAYSDNKFSFTSDFETALKKEQIEDFKDLCFKKNSIEKYIKDGGKVNLSGESYDDFVQKLVMVDNERINLTPYEESRLTDPNGGHWDLWDNEADENETLLNLNTSFYGRNPVADVKADGIVGIDFGTKSTVVTVQNGTETILPMRVGCGDYKKDVKALDYENPTFMEFINLESFIEDYKSSDYRPNTEWQDLTISHTASESLNAPKSGDEYYAWFSDLKQWASDKNRKVIIKDKQGEEYELCPFADINDSDLNPIEYYAYLLGLFINNMYNGIYINYILSFPVTYERKIRQKIAFSFEKGLKKTLPKAVQNDKNIMSLFRVMEGASEPAAYAVCALQEYGFKPENEEKILYGIFDFGGGTTDFDFGTWQRAPKKLQRRYDYVIKHFGAGGDRYLGGENLLELLAYSVFKSNEAVLRENSIQFIKPVDADKYCGIFDGSESLISNSQQAKVNQKQLIEELRPLWHGEDYQKDKVTINLYNTSNESVTINLTIDIFDLKTLIVGRISSGVENFFEAMDKALTDEVVKGVDKIYIFLAGNSSKSKYVSGLFDEYKEEYELKFAKKLNITDILEDTPGDYFVKKYKKDLPVIFKYFQEIGNYDVIESCVNNPPKDDSFLDDFEGDDFCKLIDALIQTKVVCSVDELYDILFSVWNEGNLIVSDMEEMLDFMKQNWSNTEYDGYLAIENFIYSCAETPAELRKKLANEFSPKFIQSIADKTSSALKERNEKEIFILYPPLGTDKANSIRSSKGIEVTDSITRPTGKTGVAYGLLQCRPGSRIKVESEMKDTDEIKFNFYTGYSSMGKFEVVTDRDIEYGKWIEFIDASEPDFELYFTDLPEAAGNQMSINGVSKKICRIDETMDDAMVYIRAIEPSVLEYCAAISTEDLEKQEYLSAPKKIILE